MSSTLLEWGGFPATQCVDGDLDIFCHALTESDPSLTLDLSKPIQIAYIAVYNRKGHTARLGEYTVSYRVRSTDAWMVCAEATAAADAVGPLLSECPQLAQYVRVQLPGTGRILNLAEVEVYSFSPPPPPPSPPSPPPSPPSPPLQPGSRYAYSSSDLIAALNDSAVSRIVLTAGTYEFDDDMCSGDQGGSALCIDRNVTIEAEVAGSVVLDAKGSRRVIYVSTASRAKLIGLNITGGAVYYGQVNFP